MCVCVRVSIMTTSCVCVCATLVALFTIRVVPFSALTHFTGAQSALQPSPSALCPALPMSLSISLALELGPEQRSIKYR